MRKIYQRTAILAVILVYYFGQAAAAPSNKTKVPAVGAFYGETSDGNTTLEEAGDLCKSNESEVDCDQTEYKEYMGCIEKKKTIRKKRQAQCSGLNVNPLDNVPPQDQIVLTQCEFNIKMCIVGCQNDTDCESGCPTTCDSAGALSCLGEYNNCVSNCVPGQPCETKCNSLCPVNDDTVRPLGYKTVIFQGHNDGPAEKVQVPIGIAHNITTIIKLNNYINNTNTINVPTTLNNTNLNTIHLYMNTSSTDSGRFGLGETKEGSCCFAVQPKSCRTSTSGIRCHHRRHKTCGEQCTARIIHVQNKKRCNSETKCTTSTSYVAEPNPKCHYRAQWPYVNCGVASSRRNCDGCYEHYSANSYYDVQIPERCMSCYDGGYDSGPRYRQGPFYRPNYYHQPPCYVTGTCYNPVPQYDYGYYAQPPPPPPMYYPAPPPPSYYPAPFRPNRPSGPSGPEDASEDEPTDELYPGEDEYSGHEEVDANNFREEEWETVVQKCKVVNVDDSTVIIKNCTSADLDANPYAAHMEEEADDISVSGESNMMAGPMQAPYHSYSPYTYNNYPPPGPIYYAQAPYPQYYSERQPQPHRRSRRPRDGVIRPYYYDNYGEDDDETNKMYDKEDDFWRHDEEDLVDKGFDRVV